MHSTELPSLQHLRMFEAAAALESIGRAAKHVNRSQPAVTQALAALEGAIGAKIIERHRTGSCPTEFGRILQFRTHRMFSLFEKALLNPLVGAPLTDGARVRSVLGKLTSNEVGCLIAVAEHGAIADAARHRGISPRSVLRCLRSLELCLGRPLARHSAQGSRLTQSGGELARQFSLAIKEIDYAREEIATARGATETQISIGAMPQCAASVLALAINDFLAREPGALIKVAYGPYDSLLGQLRAGKIDFLVGVLRRPESVTDIVEEVLFEGPYAIVARANHPLAGKRPLSIDELAGCEWILPQLGAPRRDAFERMFSGAKRKPIARIETSSSEIELTLIADSERVTLVSNHQARQMINSGSIAILDFDPRVSRNNDGVATRADWHPVAVSRLFWETLRKHARAFAAASA